MDLYERETDLLHLERHLQQAMAGQGRIVFLAGEAGVGKTALVEALRRRIGEDAVVLRASCDALSTPGPLGPLRDLGPALGVDPERFAADHAGRDLLFRAVLDALNARERPVVVVAEDAHWADGATVELLRFLGRRIGDHSALIVVTYRDDEMAADHPLRLLLGDLATAPTVHRLGVLPLSEAAVRQMAAGSGRDPADLHRLTGGNPFFLTEVLSADAAVPATVSDAVLARAARLSAEARAVLDVAAVIGSAIDLEILLDVAGPVLDETDACIAGGLLRSVGDGLVFRHDLVREAVLATMAPTRRRLLHARVLAALQAAPSTERDLALLAHHAEAAGDREATLQFATAAGEEAAALHAYREAAAQFDRALRVADRLPEPERARLFEGRSLACHLSDQRGEAIAARRAALSIWQRLGEPLKIGENLRWLSRVAWFDGQGAEAETAATAALDVLESLPPGPQLAMAYSNLSQLRMLDDDLAETLRWGEQAIALAEQLGETETLVHALANVGTARLYVGDARGEEELGRSVRLALAHRFHEHAGRAMQNLAHGAMRTWRLEAADRWLETGIPFAIEHDLDLYRGYSQATRAAVRARQGDWDAAAAEAREILQQPVLAPVTRIVALAALGQVLARRGDPEATPVLDEALALAERTGQLLRLEPVRAARAEAALLAGDLTRARAEALAVRDQVFAQGNRWTRGEFAWLLWRSGEQDVPIDGLAEPYALEIGGDHAGAAAAWRNLDAPYEEARALIASDDPALVRQALSMFETLGARPAIGQAIRRLRALGATDVPAARRGPRSATRAHPAGLTRREAEVLALLAEGLPTADIAARLYLAPKTVRHHVSAILAKLGVETRMEAVRAATKRGLVPS